MEVILEGLRLCLGGDGECFEPFQISLGLVAGEDSAEGVLLEVVGENIVEVLGVVDDGFGALGGGTGEANLRQCLLDLSP